MELNWLELGLIAALAVSSILMSAIAYANSSYDPNPKWKVNFQGGFLGLFLSGVCAAFGNWIFGEPGALIADGVETLLVVAIWMATGTVDALGCRPELRFMPCQDCKKPAECCKSAPQTGRHCQHEDKN